MITLLPLECYHKVINNFCDDYKSIFSCALVNRQLCRFTIPILWNEPGQHFKDERLIDIFLLMLNDEERTLLDPFNITFPNQPAPLFAYSAFINSVTGDLYFGVRSWLNERYGLDYELQDAMKYSLIRMFLRTGNNLKHLYLEEINCDQIMFKDTTVTSVDLSFSDKISHGFKYRAIDGFVTNLDQTSTLTSFNIISDHLGEGFKTLLKVLYRNTALNSFGIYNNRLGNKDGKMLAKFLCKNTTLTSLDLCGRSIKKDIGPKVGKKLAKALCKNKTLKDLKIRHYRFRSKEGQALANALCKNTTLISLDLYYNVLEPEGGVALAKALCKNTSLISLDLGHNLIGPEGAKAFAEALYKNTTLISLNIAGNFIRLEGVKALADALCKNTTLISLNLGYNLLGSEAGQVLSDALCKNTTLISLDLDHNNFGSEGVKAFTDALCKNTTLTSLNLDHNEEGNNYGLLLEWDSESESE